MREETRILFSVFLTWRLWPVGCVTFFDAPLVMNWCVEERNALYLGSRAAALGKSAGFCGIREAGRLANLVIVPHSIAFGDDETKLVNSDDS